jgi:hypothetical protein
MPIFARLGKSLLYALKQMKNKYKVLNVFHQEKCYFIDPALLLT